MDQNQERGITAGQKMKADKPHRRAVMHLRAQGKDALRAVM